MGKAALIAVFAAIIYMTIAGSTREESTLNRIVQDSDYKDEVLSRQAAESSYNIVVSRVKTDFENYRTTGYPTTYDASRIA